MGALDEYGKAIAAAAKAESIPFCVVHRDGRYLYRVRLVREDGIPADEDLSPGEFARILGVRAPWDEAA